MNQRNLWTVVAVLATVLGTSSVGRAQTTQETLSVDEVKLEQSSGVKSVGDGITKVFAYNSAGRQAATVYIRDIPVLTFLDEVTATTSDPNAIEAVNRANALAAKINDLVQQKADASKITVSWKPLDKSQTNSQSEDQNKSVKTASDGHLIISVDGAELLEINDNTRLAGATNSLADDALQATNRLRRLIGNAEPLTEVTGLPQPPVAPVATESELTPPQIVARGRRVRRGKASFYGYDGSGNRTASGERFNPENLTAAHRSLPFGTRVRVTNTRNGRSVVVRINDRGPFIRGRVIDLSHRAARVLRMIGSGVAPVKLEILGR